MARPWYEPPADDVPSRPLIGLLLAGALVLGGFLGWASAPWVWHCDASAGHCGWVNTDTGAWFDLVRTP